MNKSDKKCVALLFGGRGAEHEVSIIGAKFVFPLIDREKYLPLAVYISRSGEWLISKDENSASVEEIVSAKTELTPVYPTFKNGGGLLTAEGKFIPIYTAFPLLHGDFGEDGVVQGALECAGISYVGCGTHASAVTSDKAYTKILAEHLGIPTAKWILANGKSAEDIILARARAEGHVGYPMFIKPTRLGSSVGASPARTREEFDEAYIHAASLGNGAVLIEELISIEKELECAYFADKSKELFTNPGQISCGGEFYDYDTKYKSHSNAKVSESASVEDETVKKIKEYSKLLVKLLGIREIARIDYFLTRDGRIIFNEINTMPGFTSGSLYPRLLSSHGIPPEELVNRLILDSVQGDDL